MPNNLFKKFQNKNSIVPTNILLNSNRTAQYLYTGASFERLKAGHDQNEVFYDCFPYETEAGVYWPELQFHEVINELNSPKEFKDLLKQLQFSAYFLYRSYRQAYFRAKKIKQHKIREREKRAHRFDRAGDENRYRGHSRKPQNLPAHIKRNLEGRGKEEICPICLGVIEDENEEFKNKNYIKTCGDFQVEDLRDTELCQEYEEVLQNSDYNDQQYERPGSSKDPQELKIAKAAADNGECETSAKENINQIPVCVTILLKLETNGHNCETSILKTSFDGQQCEGDKTCALPSQAKLSQNKADGNNAFPSQLEQQPDSLPIPHIKDESNSDLLFSQQDSQHSDCSPTNMSSDSPAFYSCNSRSAICLHPSLLPTAYNDNTLNEILELLKIYCENLKTSPAAVAAIAPSEPVKETKTEPQAKETKSLLSFSPSLTASLDNKTLTGPILDTPAAPSPQLHPKTEAKEIKLELIQEDAQASEEVSTAPNLATSVLSSAAPWPQLYPKTEAEEIKLELIQEEEQASEEVLTAPNLATSALATTSSQPQPKLEAPEIKLEHIQEETKASQEALTTLRPATPQSNSLPLNYYDNTNNSTAPLPSTDALLKTSMAESEPQTNIKPPIPPKPLFIPPTKQFELPSTSREFNKQTPEHELSSNSSLIPPPPPPPPLPGPTYQSVSQQTDFSAIQPTDHYKRNGLRIKIQEELRELLQQSSSKSGVHYKAAERDEILQDFNRLINPEKAANSSPNLMREMATQNIRYLIEPDGATNQTLMPSESQATILENIRYILNPKSTPKSARRKKYSKEAKAKILEDLQLLLKPRKTEKQIKNRDIRNSILRNLYSMLANGEEMAVSMQKPTSSFTR